jgi:hypothetical protein
VVIASDESKAEKCSCFAVIHELPSIAMSMSERFISAYV